MATVSEIVGSGTANTNYYPTNIQPWVAPNTTYTTRICVCNPPTDYDFERQTIKALCDAVEKLKGLDADAWQRVADYITDRYGLTISQEDVE